MQLETTSAPETRQTTEKKRETPLEFLASMAVVLVTGLFIITFVIQAFEIPSSSMENTLLIGDHVFVDRITFAPETRWAPFVHYRHPRRGDVVVFLSPVEPGLYVVKRVIGVPGDRIHLENGTVYLNGRPQTESYVQAAPAAPPGEEHDAFRDNFPDVPADQARYKLDPAWQVEMESYVQGSDVVVPPGRYFVMGDNRAVSWDSRYWGFVPQENIIGRPLFIYWSFETPSDQYTKNTVGQRVAFLGHIAVHFFDGTRWRRMLHPIH